MLTVLQYRDIFSWRKIGVEVAEVCGKDSTQPRAGKYTTMGWSGIQADTRKLARSLSPNDAEFTPAACDLFRCEHLCFAHELCVRQPS